MRRLERDRSSPRPVAGLILGLFFATSSNLDETTPIVWTLVAIGAAGAIVTFAVLVYALHRFRDPAVRRRRYG